MQSHYDIFISHHQSDSPWVRDLARALAAQGLQAWFEEDDPRGGLFVDRMEQALRESQLIIFVVTPEAVRSNWMAAELGAGLALRKSLIPVIDPQLPVERVPGPLRLRQSLPKGDPIVVAEQVARRLAAEFAGEAGPLSGGVAS